MPNEHVIYGSLKTPVDIATGERKTILLQTTTEHVIDPSTGKNIKELVEGLVMNDVNETKSGLMSSVMYRNFLSLVDNEPVISVNNPNRPCMWYKIEKVENE
jgi:hypothetical protein